MSRYKEGVGGEPHNKVEQVLGAVTPPEPDPDWMRVLHVLSKPRF